MFANKASLFGNPKNSKLDVIHLQGVALERLKLELDEHQALTGYLRCVRGNASAHIQSLREQKADTVHEMDGCFEQRQPLQLSFVENGN